MLGRCAGLALAAAVAVAAPASAATRYVNDDGGLCAGVVPFSVTIQAAIDASGPGDVVRVCGGTYAEQLTLPDAGLYVRSTSVGAARIVTPPGGIDFDGSMVTITGTNVRFEGFFLDGPFAANCVGDESGNVNAVHVGDGASALLTLLKIDAPESTGCDSDSGSGISVAGTATAWSNTLTGPAGNGIAVRVGGGGTYHTNTITGFGGGVVLDHSAATTVRSNTLDDNSAGVFSGGTVASALSPVRILANKITGGSNGIILLNSQKLQVGQSSSGNVVSGNANAGIVVSADSTGNDIRYNVSTGNSIDCTDSSVGTGTLNTANTWLSNKGTTSVPFGICKP